MKGVIIDETTQIEVQKHEFHESPFTLSFFATLPSVEIQGLTRTEKERENAAVLPSLLQSEYTEIFSSSTWYIW